MSEENDQYSSTVHIYGYTVHANYSQKSKVATTDCIYFEVTNRDKPTNTLHEGVYFLGDLPQLGKKTGCDDSTAAISSIHAAREKLK